MDFCLMTVLKISDMSCDLLQIYFSLMHSTRVVAAQDQYSTTPGYASSVS